MHILAEIKTRYPSLTKSERRIADRVLTGRAEDIENLTLSEFAGSLGVGEATIVRFCKKIGLHGFQELRFYITLEGEKSASEENSTRDEIKRNLLSTIETTDSMLSQETIDTAIDLINTAKDVFLFGIGTSGLSASMGEARLFRFGKRTRAIVDSHAQSMQACLCNGTCLVIAVSASGETKDLLEAVSIAKDNGARILAITSYLHSSLSELSECTLLSYGSTNRISGGTFSTAVSQVYLLDLIVSGYASQHWKKVAKFSEKIGWSMMSKSST